MHYADWTITGVPGTQRSDVLAVLAADIVVVDDDADVLEALGRVLESWNYRVRLAKDGPSGLAFILERPPRVAVVDIAMPYLDGYQVARGVRAALGADGPKLVALTAFGRQVDRQRALASGFDFHLTKPARLEQLRRAIASGFIV